MSTTNLFLRNCRCVNIQTANTILYCKKWQETVRFYQEIVGLDVHFSNEWFVEFRLNDGARLSIANEARASIKSGDGLGITIGFQVDDLQRVHSFLTKSGAHPTPIKRRWGANVFYTTDPEGNRIEFWAADVVDTA